jgi:hypothetical protein
MPQKVYFDTVSFREIGKALENVALSDDLRDKVVVSPLSFYEVVSQLTTREADEVLRQIQAIHNWINPKRAGLLPWPDDALAQVGFGKATRDDDFTQRMGKDFNVCLNETSAAPLQEEAGRMKDALDAMKLETAEGFGRMLDEARKEFAQRRENGESPKGDWFEAWFSEAWFHGVVTRAKVDPNSKPVAEVAAIFSAHHVFERVKLQTALGAKSYNSEKHQNDLLVVEQLVYLGSPELCFLTCDKGFARVKQSAQAARIIIVAPEELSDVQRVEAVLRKLTDQAEP